MPVYDYRCTHCGTLYDVYHKAKEIKEDIVCPSCSSREHTKLMSVASVSVAGSSNLGASSHTCEMGGECCGGACSMN
jgi:putative FmdB family regulatory protein